MSQAVIHFFDKRKWWEKAIGAILAIRFRRLTPRYRRAREINKRMRESIERDLFDYLASGVET